MFDAWQVIILQIDERKRKTKIGSVLYVVITFKKEH